MPLLRIVLIPLLFCISLSACTSSPTPTPLPPTQVPQTRIPLSTSTPKIGLTDSERLYIEQLREHTLKASDYLKAFGSAMSLLLENPYVADDNKWRAAVGVVLAGFKMEALELRGLKPPSSRFAVVQYHVNAVASGLDNFVSDVLGTFEQIDAGNFAEARDKMNEWHNDISQITTELSVVKSEIDKLSP